jgi:hypothetical protein
LHVCGAGAIFQRHRIVRNVGGATVNNALGKQFHQLKQYIDGQGGNSYAETMQAYKTEL